MINDPEHPWRSIQPLYAEWPPVREGKYRTLYGLAREARGGCIVELGTYLGAGAICLALAAREGGRAPVFTVDDFAQRTAHCGQVYNAENLGRFRRHIGMWRVAVHHVHDEIFHAAAVWTQPIALLVGDTGDHGPAEFLAAWGRHVMPGGLYAHKLERFDQEFPLPEGWTRGPEYEPGLIRSIRREAP